MKDARGHGSSARANSHNMSFGIAPGVHLSSGMKGPQPRSDTARTIADLRTRLRSTPGEGHATGLMQGIKNFLGGK